MGIGLHLYFKNYNYVPISQTGMHTIYLLNYFHCKYHSFLYTTTIVFNYLDMSNKSLGSVCVVISSLASTLQQNQAISSPTHSKFIFLFASELPKDYFDGQNLNSNNIFCFIIIFSS